MDHHQSLLAARRSAGFTLLEAMLAMALTTVLVVSFYEMLANQSRVATEEIAETDTQTNLRRMMSELVYEIEESRPLEISTDGRSFTYALPLKKSNGQLALSSEGKVLFGVGEAGVNLAYHPDDGPDNKWTLSFVAGAEARDTLKEADLLEGDGQDLDNNGDETDEFQFGQIYLIRNDGGSAPRFLGGRCAVRTNVPSPDTEGLGKVFSIGKPTYAVGDGGDYEPFSDLNGSGIYDLPDGETFTDVNENGRWDATLTIQVKYVDVRSQFGRLRNVRTKVNYFRNAY